jgi:hypothetical protein
MKTIRLYYGRRQCAAVFAGGTWLQAGKTEAARAFNHAVIVCFAYQMHGDFVTTVNINNISNFNGMAVEHLILSSATTSILVKITKWLGICKALIDFTRIYTANQNLACASILQLV